MSTIYLDPVAMDATAGAIGERARQVQASVSTLESTGSAAVPVALGGWLAEELHDIAVQAQLVAPLYTVAALDTALRAQQIQADQSLVAALPELVSTSVDLGAGLAMGSVVGGSGPAFVSTFVGPETSVVGGTGPAFVNNFVGPETSIVGGSTRPLGTSIGSTSVMAISPIDIEHFAGLRDPRNYPGSLLSFTPIEDMNRNILAPRGMTFVNGQYEDNQGNRGDLSSVHRDPDRPGSYEVRS